MKVPEIRVTTDELLDLADTITRLCSVADEALQYGARAHLKAALPAIVEAAKSVAFNEVQIKREAVRRAAQSESSARSEET